MEDYSEYIDLAIEELENPTFEVTKQYLEVCEIELENDKPKIARIRDSYRDNRVEIYFEVKHEGYFIVVILEKCPKIEINFIETENGHSVSFNAYSENHSLEELSKIIEGIEPIEGWSIGDILKYRKVESDFTHLDYEPIKNLAYDLDEKLSLLLDDLEKYKESILELSKVADISISVCKYQYVSGNAGIHFDNKTIRRLNDLNLSIDIDTTIIGNEIK